MDVLIRVGRLLFLQGSLEFHHNKAQLVQE
jgi:hypothetical protein